MSSQIKSEEEQKNFPKRESRREQLRKIWNSSNRSEPKTGRFHSHFRSTIKPKIKEKIRQTFKTLMEEQGISSNDIYDSFNVEIDFEESGYETTFDTDELALTFEMEDYTSDEEEVLAIPQRQSNVINVNVTFKSPGRNFVFRCLFDTGSTSNLIREDVVMRVKLEKYRQPLRFPKKVLGFGGTRTPIDAWLKDAPCSVGLIPMEHSFLIVPQSAMPRHELILGFPGIKKLNLWEPLKEMIRFRLNDVKS